MSWRKHRNRLVIKGQKEETLTFCFELTRVAFVVGIFSRQMIILKLESIGH